MSQSSYTPAQRIGLGVFIVAIVAMAYFISMGMTGTPWPRWLLALTTVL